MNENNAGKGVTYNKGFTLIELLAVIVILAIIALIATPIVLDIIEDSKESSVKRSIELYADAVENSVAKAQLNGQAIPSGKYTTTDGKTLTNGNTTIKVDYDGAKTVCEVNITTQGEISLKSCKVNGKETEYTYGKIEDANNKTYTNGEVVYFNVTTGKKCSDYTEAQSNIGTKSGCMKFYAFNDDGKDTVNLILDHNTTAEVAWNKTYKIDSVTIINAKGPKEVLEQLKTDTSSWVGTITPENYSIDQSNQSSEAKYTIDYSSYKARLITAQEVATITGNTGWDEKLAASDVYYFDSKSRTESDTCKSGNTSGCKYGWLYDRTSKDCTTWGCLNNSDQKTSGYWTSTPIASNPYLAWFVDCDSILNGLNVYISDYGVRPVITVSKSKLS